MARTTLMIDDALLRLLKKKAAEEGRTLQAVANLRESGVTGNLVPDAHIAALCLEHGVTELLTGDRDFARFPSLRVSDPFRRA